jgi:hypothetical protein
MMPMRLEDLGWNDTLARQYASNALNTHVHTTT